MVCGKQIGPMTGDPRTFQSMAAVKQAFREQVFYWMKHNFHALTTQLGGQAKMMQNPFASCLLEGPLQKGKDMMEGGAWHTLYGVLIACMADAADSLTVIDKLIYRDRKITWDELLTALKANWKGYEDLRQLCINGVPKYGNDDDYADDFASFVMDTWADTIDWGNTQKDLLPPYGGKFTNATIVGNGPVAMGANVWALPNGHIHPRALADTSSPVQGVDKKGMTAVAKSVGKLPTHRFTMGTSLNMRLSPQLLATDRDVDNFVAFLRTVEELGVFHIQFNVISSATLRKAMREPEKYRDLMVRVAGYSAYFINLTREVQDDIIRRTDQVF